MQQQKMPVFSYVPMMVTIGLNMWSKMLTFKNKNIIYVSTGCAHQMLLKLNINIWN